MARRRSSVSSEAMAGGDASSLHRRSRLGTRTSIIALVELASFKRAGQADGYWRRRKAFKYKQQQQHQVLLEEANRRTSRSRSNYNSYKILFTIIQFVLAFQVLQRSSQFQLGFSIASAQSILRNNQEAHYDGSPESMTKIETRGRQQQQRQIYPSVQVTKYGLIRGLRLTTSENGVAFDKRDSNNIDRSDEFGHRTNSIGTNGTTSRAGHSSRPQPPRHRQLAVAAFLGVPYAAPPTGLLRFMPPGAARSSQRLAAASELCRPLGSPKNLPSSGPLIDESVVGPGTPVRVFTSFGHECIRLADWRRPAPIANGGDANQSATGAAGGDHYWQSRGRRELQSEDCLNLNIFVPYESSWPASYAYLGDRRQQQRVKRHSTAPNDGHDKSKSNKLTLDTHNDSEEAKAQVDSEDLDHFRPLATNWAPAERAKRGSESADRSILGSNRSQQGE